MNVQLIVTSTIMTSSTDCPICFENKCDNLCIQTPCEHSLCKDCYGEIQKYTTSQTPSCPICRAPIFSIKNLAQAKKEKIGVETYMEKFHSFIKRAGLEKKYHQTKGIEWCFKKETANESDGRRGGIIADEMGLGKTILAIGLVCCNIQDHTLIVVPPALLNQWVNVIRKFLKHNPIVYHGAQRFKYTNDEIMSNPLVLTTYSQISIIKGGSKQTRNLHEINWDRVIYDESHHLRNKNNKSRGALKLTSKISWFLSGTPVQNKIKDVVNYFRILKLRTLNERMSNEEVENAISFYTLRRTKSQANIKLPPINYHSIDVEWATELERKISQDIHEDMNMVPVTMRNVNRVMALLGSNSFLAKACRARQSCIFTKMLTKRQDLLQRDEDIDIKTIEQIKTINTSSKLDAVVKRVCSSPDKKSIIFCHFRDEIDYLMQSFTSKSVDVNFIDGRKAMHERKHIYENNPQVLILQIKTGCEGLNLQNYKQIHFTSNQWNPAVEDQAIARCYRIGQTEPVDVYNYSMDQFTNQEGNSYKNFEWYCQEVQDMKRRYMAETGFSSSTPAFFQ